MTGVGTRGQSIAKTPPDECRFGGSRTDASGACTWLIDRLYKDPTGEDRAGGSFWGSSAVRIFRKRSEGFGGTTVRFRRRDMA